MAEQRPAGGTAAPSTASKTTSQLVAETPDARADAAAEVAPEVAPEPDTSGKRVRAIPTHGGSTVGVSAADFQERGIEHPDVLWDFRNDDSTVKVGNGDGEISEEAANLITKLEPTRFEFMNG